MVAGDGRKALEIMGKERPSLVLTDIIMPEMDGYQLCQAIKKNPETCAIPVILVTQLYDPSDVLRGSNPGQTTLLSSRTIPSRSIHASPPR